MSGHTRKTLPCKAVSAPKRQDELERGWID